MTVRIATIVVMALLCAAPGKMAAQEPQGDVRPGRGKGADPDGLGPAQILNMLDAWAIVQAQDTLQLADSQYGEFVARLKRLQQTRRRGHQGRNAILQELRRLAGPQAAQIDEAAVRDRLKALAEHDERVAGELRKAYAELDQVLDTRQQARFRLFEEMLERRKIDLLKRAQDGAARQRRQ